MGAEWFPKIRFFLWLYFFTLFKSQGYSLIYCKISFDLKRNMDVGRGFLCHGFVIGNLCRLTKITWNGIGVSDKLGISGWAIHCSIILREMYIICNGWFLFQLNLLQEGTHQFYLPQIPNSARVWNMCRFWNAFPVSQNVLIPFVWNTPTFIIFFLSVYLWFTATAQPFTNFTSPF